MKGWWAGRVCSKAPSCSTIASARALAVVLTASIVQNIVCFGAPVNFGLLATSRRPFLCRPHTVTNRFKFTGARSMEDGVRGNVRDRDASAPPSEVARSLKRSRKRAHTGGRTNVELEAPDETSHVKSHTGTEGSSSTAVVLFRGFDLRLADNHALTAAAKDGTVIPAFVWCTAEEGQWGVQGAFQVYTKEALRELCSSLEQCGSKLVLREDPASSAHAVVSLCLETGASCVHLHRGHTPEATAFEEQLASLLEQSNVAVQMHDTLLLYAPDTVKTATGFNGGHWGTLMPFLKTCQKQGQPARPLPPPPLDALRPPASWPASLDLDEMKMAVMPVRWETGEVIDWGAGIRKRWRAGEGAAQRALTDFVTCANGGLQRYESERSRADLAGSTAKISLYLRSGELSPRTVLYAIRDAGLPYEATKTFGRRLHWRDLSYYHLHCFPDMRDKGIRRHYDETEWVGGSEYQTRLRAWQKGRTGYPIVDAGMRELYETGWMTQSVRMVVASFLVEYLRVSWVDGAKWFHDTLIDADSAINPMMWQNAGRSGIDQWNFVLSPENASQDPTGKYTRRWCPELASLPTQYLHRPWQAATGVLAKAGVVLGQTYPHRIVEDLYAERGKSVEAVLQMRRAHLDLNDAGGYDLIRLPDGTLHRVFTKQEYRLDAAGAKKPAPPPREQRPGGGGGRGRRRGAAGGEGGRVSGAGRGRQPSIKSFFGAQTPATADNAAQSVQQNRKGSPGVGSDTVCEN